VHAGNGWLFTSPNGGWEYPAFWTVALVVQALLGDGAFALRSAGAVRLPHRAGVRHLAGG
jgi:putative oxidoreductase